MTNHNFILKIYLLTRENFENNWERGMIRFKSIIYSYSIFLYYQYLMINNKQNWEIII